MKCRFVCIVPLTGLLALPALAVDRLVPQQYATIQAAIDAAVHGDTVLVADGTYVGFGNGNLNFNNKNITLRSVNGPENCILDGSGTPGLAVITFNHQETNEAVVDGFTITGGDQFNGGGVHIQSGSPIIQNCLITGNRCICWGAGVYSISPDQPIIRDCVITGNTSDAEGGGVFTISSNIRFENCDISGNTADTGGGICVFGGYSEFVNCQITGNIAGSYGGGGYIYECVVTNCTIAGNSAVWAGSGAYTWQNTAITNSIFWGNLGAEQIGGTPNITYSIVQGGVSDLGNMALDPQFVDAANGDYRVAAGSPAIDAGSNDAVPDGVVTDLAGSPRFLNDPKTPDSGVGSGRIVDIGAYEYKPARAGGVRR